MTDPTTAPVEGEVLDRPEPVLDAARLGGLTAAATTAVGGVVVLVLAGGAGDVNALGLAVGGAVTAVAALVAYLAPLRQARKARAKVTPLEDPRDAAGNPYGVLQVGRDAGPQVDGVADHAAPE